MTVVGPEPKTTDFKSDVPITVVLSIVISSWALLSVGREHGPGEVKVV